MIAVNLVKRLHFLLLMILIFSILDAQPQSSGDISLKIIKEVREYKKMIKADADQRMVCLTYFIPGIQVDLRYATPNNFTQKTLYSTTAIPLLRLPAAEALALVQKELAAKGLGLKVFDAYRPYSITDKMWRLIQDERYVANPAKGSGHNRGIAVDLT
jgi:D-alanyl-D-alanine dipeptidase